jgi:hypothetical protein
MVSLVYGVLKSIDVAVDPLLGLYRAFYIISHTIPKRRIRSAHIDHMM